jgi:hypothetical protein
MATVWRSFLIIRIIMGSTTITARSLPSDWNLGCHDLWTLWTHFKMFIAFLTSKIMLPLRIARFFMTQYTKTGQNIPYCY